MNGHRPQPVPSRRRRPLQRSGGWLLAAALAIILPAGPASALEIDQIRVLSGAGQPLFAQIPLVVDNPGELQSVQVALASSATFARIGLPRPQGTVATLRFSVDRNPRQPMIIVESSQPVTESFLTFLIQLQWNGGQMVREFSLSMGASAPPAPAPAMPEPVSASVSPPPAPQPVAPEAAAPQITLPTDTTVLPEQPQAIPLPVQPTPVPTADPAAVEPAAPPAPASAAAAPAVAPVQADTPPIPVIDRRPPGTRRASPPSQPAPPPQSPAAATAAAVAPIPLAGERPPPPPATAAPPAAPTPAATAAPAGPSLGPVAAGDTLTRIAQGMVEPGQSLEQVMVALVRANPQAFANGNINQLQRGAQLRVPGKADIAQMGQAQAEAAVREQTRLWLDGKAADTPALQPLAAVTSPPPPAAPQAVAPIPVVQTDARLQILPPDAGTATAPGAATATAAQNEQVASSLLQREEDIAQLKERLANLEEVSRKQQQLIAMQNEQLRSRMAGGAGSRTGWIIALVGLLLGALIWWRTRPRALLAHPDRPTWHGGAQVSGTTRNDAA